MLTSFSQVKEWIIDNGFKRWILYKDYSRAEKIIDSAGFPVSDLNDKLAMTEKYLRWAGGHAYAAGGTTNSKDDMNTVMEIQLNDIQPLNPQAAAGVGAPMQPVEDIGKIEERIRKQIKAEIAQEQYEKERKEFEAERKEFKQEKQSVIGLIVGQLAPYIPVLNSAMNKRMVAGVDAEEPVHAQPIIATGENAPAQEPGNQPETQEESPFSEEEAEELYTLMAEFKSVEPNYLAMLRKVVEMAKSGDKTYEMAKNFLL